MAHLYCELDVLFIVFWPLLCFVRTLCFEAQYFIDYCALIGFRNLNSFVA